MSDAYTSVRSNTIAGSLYIAGGFILLLHTLGILVRFLNVILIAASLLMITYGALRAELPQKFVQRFLKGERAKKSSEQ